MLLGIPTWAERVPFAAGRGISGSWIHGHTGQALAWRVEGERQRAGTRPTEVHGEGPGELEEPRDRGTHAAQKTWPCLLAFVPFKVERAFSSRTCPPGAGSGAALVRLASTNPHPLLQCRSTLQRLTYYTVLWYEDLLSVRPQTPQAQ